MAGGKFIIRWLLLAIFLAVLVIYFFFYAPDAARIPSYNDYLSHSHLIDHPPMNEPMVESGVGLGQRPELAVPTATEDSTLITLEAIEVKPTRLMPVRPVKSGAGDISLDADADMDDTFDEDPQAHVPSMNDDASATITRTSAPSAAGVATAEGDELVRDVVTSSSETTRTTATREAATTTTD